MKPKTFLLRTGCLMAVVASAAAGQVATRIPSKADQDLMTALVAAEDSRDSLIGGGNPRRLGLASPNPYIRAFAARGIGRLEHARLMPIVFPALDDSSAEVRAAAADAVAQSAAHEGAAEARAQLTRRLASERDALVRGALLEAIGRLAQGSVDQVKATAQLVRPSLTATAPQERRGAIRGLFFLSRKPEARAAGAIPAEITDSVFAMVMSSKPAGYTGEDRINLATILGNAGALNDTRMMALFGHADPYVRDKAVAALQRATDTATVRSIVDRAWKDRAPIVRYRAVGIYARRLRAADGCAPLIQASHDPDMTVAIAATDALSGCRADAASIRFLDSLAGTFRNGEAWHMASHAFVSLSVIAPERAHRMMPIFAQAENFFVRMYADTAARLMSDTVALYRLARDTQPNVRSSAIAGLSKLVGHAADSIYIAALTSDDNQLLMAAAAALKGQKNPLAGDQMVSAMSRLVQAGRQTSRDGFMVLDNAKGPILGMDVFTSRIAIPVVPTPTFADLAAMEQITATIEMVNGDVIKFRLHPFDAPTNAARFVRLATAHTFDGLTFHRVAPFFVVQGPSPNANEYSAPDGPFTRDELGVSNMRGTIGLSTRGRDTGDGQIYINTVDNTWLDHEYTVMGTITSGVEAFDRMQEGAVIRRITVSR